MRTVDRPGRSGARTRRSGGAAVAAPLALVVATLASAALPAGAADLLCAGDNRPTCDEMKPGSAFLPALNGGDETPGDARYGTFWSPCDVMVSPDSGGSLSGATDTQVGRIAHAAFLTGAGVYGLACDFVA